MIYAREAQIWNEDNGCVTETVNSIESDWMTEILFDADGEHWETFRLQNDPVIQLVFSEERQAMWLQWETTEPPEEV